MRISIGDIHGKEVWKQLVDREFDECYFVGDYFDNYEKTPTVRQVRNFREICEFARKNKKTRLCLGNHDYGYLRGVTEQYNCFTTSGFQFHGRFDIREVLEENMDLLNIVYITKDLFIISHAGVSKDFLSINNVKLKDINTCFNKNRGLVRFVGLNIYGDSPISSPIWIRPESLLRSKVEGFKQIVGHTAVEDIHTLNDITFIDVLDTVHKCFEF